MEATARSAGDKAATFPKPPSNLTRTRQLFDFWLASFANTTGYRTWLFHTFLRQEKRNGRNERSNEPLGKSASVSEKGRDGWWRCDDRRRVDWW
jgi:hypothetical protein